MISRNNIIYSGLNSAPAHLFHLLAVWQWLFLKKTNGGKIEEREPDSNIRAAQTSHKLNDTQMTEVIKCSLCHCSIAEALLHSIYLSLHKSVSTLGSLKWQCVRELCRGGMQKTGLEPICLGRFKGNFYYLLASWTHFLRGLCFHYLKWSVKSPSIHKSCDISRCRTWACVVVSNLLLRESYGITSD